MTEKNHENASLVLQYHEATKHHLDRFAKSAGSMDWKNEPNPFRFYKDAERINLSPGNDEEDPGYRALYEGRPGGRTPFSLGTVSSLMELGLGLSALKKYGSSEWVLRMNPSSGNLHPTECYLILPARDGRRPFIAHYNPMLHCLEVMAFVDYYDLAHISTAGGFVLILTSVYWRESWKYGERAFRYCNHDVGHALASLRFSAGLLGWQLEILPGLGERILEKKLGFEDMHWAEGEEEYADCACWVNCGKKVPDDVDRSLSSLEPVRRNIQPNLLSARRLKWDIITAVSRATTSEGTEPVKPGYPERREQDIRAVSPLSAKRIIRQRRSAQAYDMADSRIELPIFLSMLERTVPSPGKAPFDCYPYGVNTHLALFVHNVKMIEPGLYLLVRNRGHEKELRALLKKEFLWEKVEKDLPLYMLAPGDFRRTARMISCHQDIAADSSFSMGMLARFEPVIEEGPWMYRRLFWETGIIGQVLYLEAEAHGLRGTGIGCFFDDEMHGLLGIRGKTFCSLYHFTVGRPLTDPRIRTLDPYYHLKSTPNSKEPDVPGGSF